MIKRGSHAWTYTPGETGPENWAKTYPAAGGCCQSPINIDTKSAVYLPSLTERPLLVNHTPITGTLVNFEHRLQFTVDKEEQDKCWITGGPYGKSKFNILQFHFHWSPSDSCGAEHLIDGKSFSGELHIVHYNKEKYADVPTCLEQKDGLGVFAVFLDLTSEEHKGLKSIVDFLGKVKFQNEKFQMPEFNPGSLLPANLNEYWTYQGSLTQPPCREAVTWTIFRQPSLVATTQLNKFRSLFDVTAEEYKEGLRKGDGTDPVIESNVRPVQPVNDRTIYQSMKV